MPNPDPGRTSASPPARPVVANYIVTFLKPEMLHIYRQVRRLQRWEPVVICQKRENPSAFPFEAIEIVPKPRTHQLRRLWQKSILRGPITIFQGEVRRLRRVLERIQAQVLHVYFGHIGVHLLPLLEQLPIPFVVSFHGADAQVNLDQPKHRAATRRMLGLARLVLVRSESLRERLVKMGCDAGKIRVHRTGIPVDELAFRQRSVPEDGAWRCVQACRLIPKKGITTAIRTFAAFQKEFPKARLTVAGEGIERDKAWRLALDLGIQGKVNFTGFMSQPELRALYNDAHIFIHPSQMGEDGDQEGVPNAILEAMAMGVPILATRHGGIPEAVEHNVSGLLVEERDHEAAARELLALARDPARYAAMSAAAGARVRSIFDVKATAAALEAIYDEARGQI